MVDEKAGSFKWAKGRAGDVICNELPGPKRRTAPSMGTWAGAPHPSPPTTFHSSPYVYNPALNPIPDLLWYGQLPP